jgi:SAM-dependent methyltransferase
MSGNSEIHRDVANYYSEKIREHGATARGVDWNSEASQILRFDQLLRAVNTAADFSLNEIGCGYGALVDYLRHKGCTFRYHGVDLSADMVAAAQARHREVSNVSFSIGAAPDSVRDYCLASGIFNVRLKTSDADWFAYVLATLDTMHESSLQGFAFNALTAYSDTDRMRDYLYYADPMRIFDHCKRRYSRNVALLHDYGIYEFTILVRKNVP